MSQEELFRIQHENARRYAVLRPVAKKLVGFIPDQTEESLIKEMNDIAYLSSRDFEPAIEDGSAAVAQLSLVSVLAEELKQAIRDLGPGALMVLNQSTAPELLKNDADAHELPLADNAPPESSLQELVMLQRGGKWIVRLGAIAEFARLGSARVQMMIRSGSPRVFQRSLADTEQRQIIRACIKYLRERGAPERLALPMARAIQEILTGEKPNKGWGRTPLSELLRSTSNKGTVRCK